MDLVAGGRLDAEGAEEGGELQVGEAAVGVHVEPGEDVAELLELIVGLVELGHGGGGGRKMKEGFGC